MLLPRIHVLTALLCPLAFAANIPSPATQSTTIIDVLSSDPDYTLLLQLVQRAKLVPTLNRLNGSTLFAPTNDAIERERKKDKKSVWSLALGGNANTLADNIQAALRQHLFYHLLNYTLDSIPKQPTPQLTLHFPALPVEPPTSEPPPSPPWLPKPGGLLDGEPQRLRTAVRDGKSYVGVDFKGRGGAKAVKDLVKATNGNVYGIDRVLDLPRDLLQEVARHPNLSVISRLLPDALRDSLSKTPHLTLFFPLDGAWESLDPIERRYLESGFAEKDMAKIVGLHASGTGTDGHGQVGWSETWQPDVTNNFTTIEGHVVRVNVSSDGSATVSGRPIVEQDIYAANGVLHTVNSLLLNPDIFQLNAEKYLLALNATKFVGYLRAANMSHYVDNRHDDKPWTILAPRDDIFPFSNPRWANSPFSSFGETKPNMTELSRLLQYHFIPGKLKPEDLENGSLLGTELLEEGLKGSRQLVEVGVHNVAKTGGIGYRAAREIEFGGALVIGDPVEIGDNIIYVLSKALKPPTDVIDSSLPSAHLSTFLTSVFATHLDDVLRNTPSTTALIPHNSAWSPLGLLTDYLLMPESKEDLKNVVLHHVLKEIIYPGDAVLGSKGVKTYATLEGSDIRIEGGRATASGGWITSAVDSPIRIQPRGILTRTGAIHELVGGVLIPRSVQVDIGDLAAAGKASIMISLVQKAGYGGVLNGTMKLDLDEWEDGLVPSGRKVDKDDGENKPKKEEVGWTLLCPRDESFKRINLTRLLADEAGLKSFVKQHIIPLPASTSSTSWKYLDHWSGGFASNIDDEGEIEEGSRPLPVSDRASYSTLLSPNALHGDIIFRLTGSNVNSYLVGIKGVKGKELETEFARVLKWGRTTLTSSSAVGDTPVPAPNSEQAPMIESHIVLSNNRPTSLRSGVVLIDRPLVPYEEDWWTLWGKALTVGVFGSFGILGFWYLVVRWWRAKESEATYEPIGGHDDE